MPPASRRSRTALGESVGDIPPRIVVPRCDACRQRAEIANGAAASSKRWAAHGTRQRVTRGQHLDVPIAGPGRHRRRRRGRGTRSARPRRGRPPSTDAAARRKGHWSPRSRPHSRRRRAGGCRVRRARRPAPARAASHSANAYSPESSSVSSATPERQSVQAARVASDAGSRDSGVLERCSGDTMRIGRAIAAIAPDQRGRDEADARRPPRSEGCMTRVRGDLRRTNRTRDRGRSRGDVGRAARCASREPHAGADGPVSRSSRRGGAGSIPRLPEAGTARQARRERMRCRTRRV